MSICHHLMLNVKISLFNHFCCVLLIDNQISLNAHSRKIDKGANIGGAFFQFLIPSLASYRFRQTYFLESRKNQPLSVEQATKSQRIYFYVRRRILFLADPGGRNTELSYLEVEKTLLVVVIVSLYPN